MKNLIVFGDSWPYGSDLEEPETDCFPNVMAEKLGYRLFNFSKPSTSQDQAVYKFLRLLNSDIEMFLDSKILFCFTAISRSIYFINGEDFEIHHTDRNFKDYYTRIYSEELGQFTYTKNLLLVQNLCKNLSIPVYCVSNWDTVPDHKMIDKSTVYDKTLFEILGIPSCEETAHTNHRFQNNPYLLGSCHPNKQGHKLIAQELSSWINST
jgi:hypothetical protein